VCHMADPFADIDGIVQVREEEVPVAESSLLAPSHPPTGNRYIERFPKELQEKAAHDLENRIALEKAIHATMTELHNVREQLYMVRFDGSRDEEEVRKDAQNYICEIDRLESKVSKLRERLLEQYLFSLNLEKLKLPTAQFNAQLRLTRSMIPQMKSNPQMDRLLSDSFLPPNRPSVAGKFGRLKSREELERSVHHDEGHVMEREPLLKLSFASIRSKTPSANPKSPSSTVFGRLFEGKTDEMADPDARRKLIHDEMVNLRAALYQLKQQKELTPADEEMVEIFTAKLRALNDL